MESHDDKAKRRYHKDLIRSALKEQFQQASEIRVVRSPGTLSEVFHVDFEEAPSEHRLRVPRAVLEYSRCDSSEIEQMVVRAAMSMRSHPQWLVTVNDDLSLFAFYTPR